MNSRLAFYATLHGARDRKDPEHKLKCARGSQGGMLREGDIFGGSSACPRVALLRRHGVESPKDLRSLLTFAIGETWETVFKLGKHDQTVESWLTDVELDVPLPDVGTNFSGRPDHVVTYKSGRKVVYETKSVSSQSKFQKVFLEKDIPVEYLAQLVSYMDVLDISEGYLAFGAFLWGRPVKGVPVQPNVLEVRVDIDADGRILVDGCDSGFTVQNQRLHRQLLGWVLVNDHVYEGRPSDSLNACRFCPFSSVCDTLEREILSTVEFVDACREVAKRGQAEIEHQYGAVSSR